MPVAPTSKMQLSMCSVLAWAGGRAGILTDSRQLCQPIRGKLRLCQPMTVCVWEHATSWTTESDNFKKVCIAMTHDTILISASQVESGSRQGKWLLYLTDAIEVSPPGVGHCFINPRNINFLGLRRRQQELVTQPPPPGPLVTSQGKQGAAYNSISSGEQWLDIRYQLDNIKYIKHRLSMQCLLCNAFL